MLRNAPEILRCLPSTPHLPFKRRFAPRAISIVKRRGGPVALKQNRHLKGTIMPLIDIQLIEGVFTPDQKKEMIEKVTDTMVGIEGEAMRGVTWVRIQEFQGGDWAIGGKAMSTADVKALAKG
jgi:4-oxalocrotonate tautomerase